MVNPVAVGFGAGLVLVFVALHFARGTGWEATADISEEVVERRASTVEETEFPEPGNRAIGGGSAPTGAVAVGEEGELEGGEAVEESTDPGDIPDDEIEHYEVEFVKEGETIEVANNETLLDAGEDEGWDLPYACRQGQCVSCGGQIQGGDALDYVRHSNNEALFEDDMEDGYCLTCVAYPTDGFTIETGEQP